MEEGLGVYCVLGVQSSAHLVPLLLVRRPLWAPRVFCSRWTSAWRGNFLGHKFASVFSLCFSHFWVMWVSSSISRLSSGWITFRGWRGPSALTLEPSPLLNRSPPHSAPQISCLPPPPSTNISTWAGIQWLRLWLPPLLLPGVYKETPFWNLVVHLETP